MNVKSRISDARLLPLLGRCLFILLSLFVFLQSCNSARTASVAASREIAEPAPIMQKVVRVGVYQNSPKIFIKNGKPQGLWIDLIEYIAQQENWRLDYREGSWEENLQRLSNGEIDLLPDVAFSEERTYAFDFGKRNIMHNWTVIYTRSGFEIDSIADLENRKVAVMRGSFSFLKLIDLLNDFSVNVEFVEVESFAEVFELLQTGQADAGVTNRLFGLTHEKNYQVNRSPITCCPAELKFAVKMGTNAELLQTLDNRIRQLKNQKNSFYYQNQEKWLGFLQEQFPTWVIVILPILIVLALTFFGFTALLRTKVKSRTRELARSNQQLLDLELMRNNFLSNVSHELRTPLVVIKGFSELLKQQDPPFQQRGEWLEKIGASCIKLEGIIEALLEISSMQMNLRQFQMSAFQIDDLIKSILDTFRAKITSKQIQVDLRMAEPVPLLWGDPKSITSVLLNLLDNAIKFSNQNGRIDISVKQNEERELVVSFRDYGIGIPEQYINKVFERFYQVDPTSSRRYDGMGIGLAFVKEIVEFHEGRVWVESAADKGSTFFFTLPIPKGNV